MIAGTADECFVLKADGAVWRLDVAHLQWSKILLGGTGTRIQVENGACFLEQSDGQVLEYQRKKYKASRWSDEQMIVGWVHVRNARSETRARNFEKLYQP